MVLSSFRDPEQGKCDLITKVDELKQQVGE